MRSLFYETKSLSALTLPVLFSVRILQISSWMLELPLVLQWLNRKNSLQMQPTKPETNQKEGNVTIV